MKFLKHGGNLENGLFRPHSGALQLSCDSENKK